MKETFWKGIEAGFLIVIGCTVYLSCDNRYIGAFLFATALCAICTFGKKLYTGMVGFIHEYSELKSLAICLIGNLVGCMVGGFLIHYALPAVAEAAIVTTSAKIVKSPMVVFIQSIFCGALMTVAVGTYRTNDGISKYIGIFTCVPTFILSGFEHSIADAAFVAISGIMSFTPSAILFLICAILGNAAGSRLIRIT